MEPWTLNEAQSDYKTENNDWKRKNRSEETGQKEKRHEAKQSQNCEKVFMKYEFY